METKLMIIIRTMILSKVLSFCSLNFDYFKIGKYFPDFRRHFISMIYFRFPRLTRARSICKAKIFYASLRLMNTY